MVYSFATHLIIKFWGDFPIMLMSLAAIVLYIPSTVVMMRKFRAISVSGIDNPNTSGQQVHTFVKNQYILLSEFFRFKKRFDWVGIPLSCFILVIAGFKIYIPGGVEEHIIGGLCSFVVLLIIFVTAILFENRKRFIRPLRQLEAVLEDLKST
jgi:hypothetical protein